MQLPLQDVATTQPHRWPAAGSSGRGSPHVHGRHCREQQKGCWSGERCQPGQPPRRLPPRQGGQPQPWPLTTQGVQTWVQRNGLHFYREGCIRQELAHDCVDVHEMLVKT